MNDEYNNVVTELSEEVKIYRALYGSVNSEVTKVRKSQRILVVMLSVLTLLFITFRVLSLMHFYRNTQTTETNCNSTTLIKTSFESYAELGVEASNCDYVTLPFVESIVVTKDKPLIDLYNPIENKDLFEIAYVFKDTKENVIFKSDYVSPGKSIAFNVSEHFPKGTSSCICSIVSRYIDSKRDANGAVYRIDVCVKE